jgi:hypothetical protein
VLALEPAVQSDALGREPLKRRCPIAGSAGPRRDHWNMIW